MSTQHKQKIKGKEDAEMKAEIKEKMQEMLDAAVANKELAGGSMLIRQGGEEICYLESGMADKEKGEAIRRDHIYRLYSMSKPVTGAAAMILFEQGKLDLAESVSSYLPAFSGQMVEENGRLVPAEREVTVKDLLGMTSGLVYNGNPGPAGEYATEVFNQVDERLLTAQAMTTVEIAEALGRGPLKFHPGTSWLYGTSADVLGAVIEAASGMTFGAFLEKNLFGPLGMKDTGFFVPEEKKVRLAAAYRLDENGELVRYEENHLGIINAMDRQPAFESGGAGLVSTIDDYARFAQMLLNEGELDGRRILQPATVRFMTAGQLDQVQRAAFVRNFSNMPGFSYGNLMRVMKDPGQSVTLNHVGEYGWDGWLGCYFANDPAAGMTMLFMMQKTDSGLTSVVRRMRNLFISGTEE